MRTLVLTMLFCALPAAALAGGTVDISGAAYGLSSPSGAYGPWVYENIDVTLPPSGTTGLHFENRHASDKFHPTTESQFGIDTYKKISSALTLYAGAFAGTGAPYFRDRFTAEADVNVGRGFVPFVGGSLGSGYGVGPIGQITAGTYYYFGDDYFAVRYTPTWSKLLGQTQGYSATLALGHPGRTVHTFRIGVGGENDVSLINPDNPSIIGEREFAMGFDVKHWTTKTGGFHAGIEYGALSHAGGAQIYSRIGGRVGVFFELR